jgi:hypothetical protein
VSERFISRDGVTVRSSPEFDEVCRKLAGYFWLMGEFDPEAEDRWIEKFRDTVEADDMLTLRGSDGSIAIRARETPRLRALAEEVEAMAKLSLPEFLKAAGASDAAIREAASYV